VPGNAWAARADGKCNREQTAKAARPARVKRWGKSPPRRWQQSTARQTPPGARPNRGTMTRPASFPGRSLERRGDAAPRGMTVTPQGAQNPAYRPTPLFLRSSLIAARCRGQEYFLTSPPQLQKRPSMAALMAASPPLRWGAPAESKTPSLALLLGSGRVQVAKSFATNLFAFKYLADLAHKWLETVPRFRLSP